MPDQMQSAGLATPSAKVLYTCFSFVHYSTCNSTGVDNGSQHHTVFTAAHCHCGIALMIHTVFRTFTSPQQSNSDLETVSEPFLGASSSWSSGVATREPVRSFARCRLILMARTLHKALHIQFTCI